MEEIVTDTEKRRAIAEFAGWKLPSHPECVERFKDWQTKGSWCIGPDDMNHLLHDMPDYLGDLNAIRDVTCHLPYLGPEMGAYIRALKEIVAPSLDWELLGCVWSLHNATASQRADALLAVIGKGEK